MAVSPKLRRDIVFWGLVAATSFAFNRLDTQKRSHFHTAATSHNGDHGVFAQTLAVCVLSMLANIGVVAYHSTFPPHPKFTLLPRRRLCLHIHIAAGIVEIFGMTVAFFAANPTPFAYLAVAAAFLGHIPSAIYQWPIVFGIKSVMLPSYFMFIVSHIWAAYHLMINPTDAMNLLRLCIALHGYVWVRVSILVFHIMDILQGLEYSVAIFFAGFLMTPMLFGPGSNFLFLVAFLSFHFLVAPLLSAYGIHFGGINKEFDRDLHAIDKAKREAAMHAMAGLADQKSDEKDFAGFHLKSDEDLAEIVFRRLDENGDGKLQHDELRKLAVTLGYPASDVERLMKKWDTDGSGDISFKEFYNHVWNYGKWRNKIHAANQITFVPEREVSREEKARIVYNTLADEENAEGLTKELMADLLMSWALPMWEVREYMARFDTNGDGMIDLDEFTEHFAPFYEYSYLLLAAEMGSYSVVSRRRTSLDNDEVSSARRSIVS